jgi:hypothetical protein
MSKVLDNIKYQFRILYPAKLSSKVREKYRPSEMTKS